MTSTVCNWNPRDDEWVPISSLYESYLGEPRNEGHKSLGWTLNDIRDMRLDFSNPPIEMEEFDKPVVPFKISIAPKLMPMKDLE